MRTPLFRQMLAAITLLMMALPAAATIIPREEAVEAVAVTVTLRDDLTGRISGRSCNACETKTFPLTPETQAVKNNQRVDLLQLRSLNGKPATIIYNIRTGLATRILWFGN